MLALIFLLYESLPHIRDQIRALLEFRIKLVGNRIHRYSDAHPSPPAVAQNFGGIGSTVGA